MGGIDKTALQLTGQSVLSRTVRAAREACDGAVVVVGGAPDALPGVIRTSEQPPGGGPVAALAAGLSHIDAEWTFLLAGDLVDGARVIAALTDAAADALAGQTPPEAVVLADPDARPQWLCARVRTAALRRAVAAIPPRGARLSTVYEKLRCAFVADTTGASRDIDTWQDLSRARARQRSAAASARRRLPRADPETPGGSPVAEHPLPPEALAEWTSVLRDRFGLTEAEVPIADVLDLARDVAHDVARPAAPLSAFIAGLVAGRAGATEEATTATLAEIVELAQAWADADTGESARTDL